MTFQVQRNNNLSMFDIRQLSQNLLKAIALNFVICVVLPGFIANYRNVFTKSDLYKTITNKNDKKIVSILTEKQTEGNHDTLIIKMRDSLEVIAASKIGDSSKTTDQAKVLTEFVARRDKAYSVATFISFSENRNVFIWWLLISCLWFVTISCPVSWKANRLPLIQMVLWTLICWGVFYGFYMLRNGIFNTYETGRRVFSYTHWDIDLPSAIVHALIILLFCYWVVRLIWITGNYSLPESGSESDVEVDVFQKYIQSSQQTTREYERWIFNSVLIGAGFIGFLSVYKTLIFVENDARYIPSAILMFLYWCLCWYAVSQPLIKNLAALETLKAGILVNALQSGKDYAAYDNFIKENTFLGKPSLFLTFLISLAAVLGSVVKFFSI